MSDLDREEREAFLTAWPQIEAARRRQVVRDLGEIAEDNVDLNFDAVLLVALGDADPEVRLGAIQGLWEYDERGLIEPLIRMMDRDDDEGVRAAAARALGKFVVLAEFDRLRGDDANRVIGALRSAYASSGSPLELRARALESLGAHSHPWVHEIIRAALHAGNQRLLVSAIHAMGRSCDPDWLPDVLQRLNDPDSEVRYEAAIACGSIGDETTTEDLLPLLTDEDAEVQLAAVDALGKIGGARAREELDLMLRHDEPRMREAAETALAEIDFNDDPLLERGDGLGGEWRR